MSSYLVSTASQTTSQAAAHLQQPLHEVRHCLLRWGEHLNLLGAYFPPSPAPAMAEMLNFTSWLLTGCQRGWEWLYICC